MDEATIRYHAFNLAIDTHPGKFDIANKPSLDDLLERAERITKFLKDVTDV